MNSIIISRLGIFSSLSESLPNDFGYTIYLINKVEEEERDGTFHLQGHSQDSLLLFMDYARSFQEIEDLRSTYSPGSVEHKWLQRLTISRFWNQDQGHLEADLGNQDRWIYCFHLRSQVHQKQQNVQPAGVPAQAAEG